MSSRSDWKRYSALLAALAHEGDKRPGMRDDASDVDSTQATCHVDSQYDSSIEGSTVQFSRRPRSQSASAHRERRPVPQEKLFPVERSKFSSRHDGPSPRSEVNEPAKQRKSPRALQHEHQLHAASRSRSNHSPAETNASMKEIVIRTGHSRSQSKSRSLSLEPNDAVLTKRSKTQSKRPSSLESKVIAPSRPVQPGVIVRTRQSESQPKQIVDVKVDSHTKAVKSERKQRCSQTEAKQSVRSSRSESKPKRRPSPVEPIKVITGSFQERDTSPIVLDASFETQRWIDEPSMSVECKLSSEDDRTSSSVTDSLALQGEKEHRDASATNITPEKDLKCKEKGKKTDRVSFPKEELVMKTQHVRLFGHGRFWTVAALVMSFFGTLFSFLARRSTAFVHLAEPIDIAPIYYPVHKTGMLRMEICYNETMGAGEGCSILRLSTADIDDNIFNLARLLLTLGSMLGCFFSIFLTSAVFWESINLRVIGFGYMTTYFVQSFSMLFFDTQICSDHDCKIGPGCVFCIIACLGWIGACIATAKMDAHKIRELRRRRRRERRRLRELRKTNAMIRKQSTATENTDASSDSSQEIDIEIGATGEVYRTTHCEC